MDSIINKVNYDIIEFLENQLKYINGNPLIETQEVKKFIYCIDNKWFWSGFKPLVENVVDCDDNVNLFKAVAAIKDDTDSYQWFASNYYKRVDNTLIPEKFCLCETPDYKDWFGDNPYMSNYDDWHKASVDELKYYFKHKNE